MLKWLWYLGWYRKMRQRQRLLAEETMVCGLAYSDSILIPTSVGKIKVRLAVKDSPIFPSGTPKPSRSVIDQDQSSRVLGEKVVQGEWIQSNFFVRVHWRDEMNCIRHSMCARNPFARVDVIAVFYDRSKPETLHGAIYKVRV